MSKLRPRSLRALEPAAISWRTGGSVAFPRPSQHRGLSVPASTLWPQPPESGKTLAESGSCVTLDQSPPLSVSAASSENLSQCYLPGLLRGINEMWAVKSPQCEGTPYMLF